jgi:hypothetical protein
MIDREWVAAEFSKGIDAEQSLFLDAKARVDDPPDPSLAVLYNEIAGDDARHRDLVETVAIRYGYTPTHKNGTGITETITRLKEKVTGFGAAPLDRVGHDLAAKANAIHWYTAWIAAFDAAGETESVRDLTAILSQERAHRDALQVGLNRLVEAGLRGACTARK